MECEKGKNAYNYENVMGIIQKVPRDAQVNFFSATFSKTIRDGINDVLNPRDTTVVHIRVKDEGKLNIKAIT